jgi:glycosyltransferase involved in cell wall biosynthesis
MTAREREHFEENRDAAIDSITVVIPTKDRPQLAANAAKMALAQRGVSPQVIVVDNGSSPENAATLRAILDPRASLITEPARIGVSAARNLGLRAATTRWVAFLDDDDYWTPDKLATQLRALGHSPSLLWVMSGAVAVTEDGRFVGLSQPATIANLYREVLVHSPPAAMSDLVVDRITALAIGGFRTDLAYWEDWDFVIRFAECAPEAAAVADPLGVYWIRKSGVSSNTADLSTALDVMVDLHAARRDAMSVVFDRVEIDYYLAYRATRFPDGGRYASNIYRSLFRRTRRPQFAVYVALSRFMPKSFSRLTEWDRLRRLSKSQRRQVSGLIAEARSSPFSGQ